MSKPTVLIVDDQEPIRTLLIAIIERLNGEVVAEAADGEEAVALYSELKPQITLMDINMPKKDGVSALREIMAIDRNALIIMLTSQNSMDVVKECLLIGAKNFLLKSNDPEELAKEIHDTWLEYRKATVSVG